MGWWRGRLPQGVLDLTTNRSSGGVTPTTPSGTNPYPACWTGWCSHVPGARPSPNLRRNDSGRHQENASRRRHGADGQALEKKATRDSGPAGPPPV